MLIVKHLLVFCFKRKQKLLEILRLYIRYKKQRYLRNKYGKYISEEIEKYDWKAVEQVSSRRVWICWWQGMDNAPLLVRRCYDSVKSNLVDWKITVITLDNYKEYVQFPDYILQRWQKGQISNTHMSDLLRLELIVKYGGLWLDSTVLCTGKEIPESIIRSNLFVYQLLRPGITGRSLSISSWLIYAKSNNKILYLTKMLLYKYWQKNERIIDYFIFHHFFSIVLEYCQEEQKQIPKYCNSIPHILLFQLFEEYDGIAFHDLKQMTCFHKLSYKLNQEDLIKPGTYYDVILNNSFYSQSSETLL